MIHGLSSNVFLRLSLTWTNLSFDLAIDPKPWQRNILRFDFQKVKIQTSPFGAKSIQIPQNTTQALTETFREKGYTQWANGFMFAVGC